MIETLIDGRYLLLEAIGSGGEARVYRARDLPTDNEVAVRLALKPVTYAAPDSVPSHPNWVHFFRWGVDPHRGAYQIFELLHGETLFTRADHQPLEPDACKLFALESLDAIAALHDTGWIHGDLNADNFFFTTSPQFRWKLLELPFLRFDPPPDRTALFGSIHTLAPEQIDGAMADIRSDLYALGCLYYYASCGEFPHSGATIQDIAIQRLCFAPPLLSEKAPSLPTAWCDGVMALLARNSQDRPASTAAARQLLGFA